MQVALCKKFQVNWFIVDAVTIGMIKSMYGVLQLLTAPFAGSASDIYGRYLI